MDTVILSQIKELEGGKMEKIVGDRASSPIAWQFFHNYGISSIDICGEQWQF
jgi:hypothetical protein